MAYLPPLQSDKEAIVVLASTAFTAGGAPTGPLDVTGYKSVDFIIETTTLASVTAFTVSFSGTKEASPSAATDWFGVMSETETATPGEYETTEYVVKRDGLSGSNNGQKWLYTVPVRGSKMVAYITPTGSITGSAMQVWALRRA